LEGYKIRYDTKTKELDPLLFILKNKLDPYEWITYFINTTLLRLNYGTKVETTNVEYFKKLGITNTEEALLVDVSNIDNILNKFPILSIDSSLDSLIYDSKADFNDINVPYPAMFINKKFKLNNGTLMGLFIFDIKQYTYISLLEHYKDPIIAKNMLDKISSAPGLDNDLPKISFDFVFMEDNEDGDINFVIAGSDEVFTPESQVPKEFTDSLKTVMNYSLNICNLIINKIDLQNPMNHKKDVRLIPHYPSYSPKGNTKGNFQIIRVFGKLKNYVEEYNKVKRKHGNIINDTTLVRGHWRHFKHEKYAKSGKLGDKVWIVPYIRGETELHKRLIKLQE